MEAVIAKEALCRLLARGTIPTSESIRIQVFGDTVVLQGEVDLAWKVQAAQDEVRSLPGVKTVLNFITVSEVPEKPTANSPRGAWSIETYGQESESPSD